MSGTGFVDVLELFNADPETEAVVLIGEIGGTKEQEAAAYIAERVDKPVAALIVGQTAPPGRRMGHAGAVITGKAALASEKVARAGGCGLRRHSVAGGDWRDGAGGAGRVGAWGVLSCASATG